MYRILSPLSGQTVPKYARELPHPNFPETCYLLLEHWPIAQHLHLPSVPAFATLLPAQLIYYVQNSLYDRYLLLSYENL